MPNGARKLRNDSTGSREESMEIDMPNTTPMEGDRVEHGDYGIGTVHLVSCGIMVIHFDNGYRVLIPLENSEEHPGGIQGTWLVWGRRMGIAPDSLSYS